MLVAYSCCASNINESYKFLANRIPVKRGSKFNCLIKDIQFISKGDRNLLLSCPPLNFPATPQAPLVLMQLKTMPERTNLGLVADSIRGKQETLLVHTSE